MQLLFIFLLGGLFAGLLAGLLGIGGGTVLVPILTALGYGYDHAVATSSLAIAIISFSGTVQNWRMGVLDFKRVVVLAIPAMLTAQVGVFSVGILPDFIKEAAFGGLLLITIFLVSWRKYLTQNLENQSKISLPPWVARAGTGAAAGFLAGLFGVGGGVIMVPLQMLLLAENIKTAIQTSLGVIVITSIAACWGHAQVGNVQFLAGLGLGIGGLVGAQVSTRYLPKLPDQIVTIAFRLLLAILALYFFGRAWNSYAIFIIQSFQFLG